MNPNSKAPVYIIIPAHNRRQTTLACLDVLNQQGILIQYTVVVVDDGSTDGTEAAIASSYPEVVVLKGDGNLWWTGAIRKGMEYAIDQGAEFLIWLNDDCYPQPDAIQTLVEKCKADPAVIAGGQSFDPATNRPSYGGITCKGVQITHIHAAKGSVLECDGLAGNFVCIPKRVVESIGYPKAQWCPHYYGDVVYTHQAKRKGYKLLIFGDAIALCKDDHPPISWMSGDRSPIDIWKERFSIKSPHYWKAHLNYYREMMGIVGIGFYIYQLLLKFLIISVIIFLIPKHQRIRLKQLISNKS